MQAASRFDLPALLTLPFAQPLWIIVGTTLSVAGWYLTRNPTTSNSENKVGKTEGSEPWHTGKHAKYEFHPHGDTSAPRKEAPSALNEVIVPNVTLPKVSFIVLRVHQE